MTIVPEARFGAPRLDYAPPLPIPRPAKGESVCVEGDEARLVPVVTNLLENGTSCSWP